MTADELLRLPDDGLRHELVRGELTSMPPAGFEHGDLASHVDWSLRKHVTERKLGKVVVGDVGFKIAADPDTVRAPDVAFIRAELVAGAGRVTGFWDGAPDLAVEVISPNDLYTEVDEKVAEWLDSGTQMVLIVNPRRRTVAIHRPSQPVRILSETDVLKGEDVVPGWSLPLRELFASNDE
jgi:Uma2 family endonuclease